MTTFHVGGLLKGEVLSLRDASQSYQQPNYGVGEGS